MDDPAPDAFPDDELIDRVAADLGDSDAFWWIVTVLACVLSVTVVVVAGPPVLPL